MFCRLTWDYGFMGLDGVTWGFAMVTPLRTRLRILTESQLSPEVFVGASDNSRRIGSAPEGRVTHFQCGASCVCDVKPADMLAHRPAGGPRHTNIACTLVDLSVNLTTAASLLSVRDC